MKLVICLAVLMGGAIATDKPTAMSQTVKLIQGLAANVKKDGKAEQASFDTYACWCEKTMERKAKDISDAKDLISEMQTLIKKLKGEIASHGAEIQQLQKDIAQNAEAVKEATGLRNKENKDYAGERTESEQCIGALEAGINVLSGAGTKKAAFLEGDSLHAAQLLSVVAGLKTALAHKSSHALSDAETQIMNHFVTKPEDFVGRKGMIAAQTGQNPFGDYAPQSSQITGILQGMYDAMTADLEKDNANEADAQKSFEELMATKAQERKTLEATLQKQETDSAAKTKSLSESEVTEDDTTEQMTADEDFFEDTKENCQTKATQWSVRVRMRTEELNGMELAIKILSGGAKTFESSTSTFVQLSAVTKHADAQSKAYNQLRALASQYASRSVAKIAVEVKMGGHFDKVITMVDEMIAVLRREEADDIAHRDRCENAENANKNEAADLAASIKKTKASLKRMGNTKTALLGEIKTLGGEIADTKKSQEDLLDFRNKDSADFKQALKDDHDAANLLRKAIEALSSFYKRNKMDVPALVQANPKKAEYAQDADKAPEASFSGDYGGRKSESGGILAILAMLVEDTEKEMAEGRADDADAQEKYLKQNGALQATLDSQEDTKASTESELGDLEEKMNDYDKFKNEKQADAGAEDDNKKAIGTDCAWVKTHFKDRRTKRKTEIQGLVDAKGFLAGTGDGLP